MEYIKIEDTSSRLWKETAQIMSESFPIHELRTGKPRDRVAQDPAFYPVAVRKNEETVAAIYSWELNGLIYIEHFAVRKDMRGRGTGSNALKGFISGREILLEIEPPVDEIKIKRLNFYQRLGFVRTGIIFMHPAFVKDAAPYPLEVLTYPERISPEGFHAFRREFDERICLYTDKKNIRMTGITGIEL